MPRDTLAQERFYQQHKEAKKEKVGPTPGELKRKETKEFVEQVAAVPKGVEYSYKLEERKKLEEALRFEKEKARKEFEKELRSKKEEAYKEFELSLVKGAHRAKKYGVPEETVTEWMVKEGQRFEKNIQEWEEEQWGIFQKGIEEWKEEQREIFEPLISEYAKGKTKAATVTALSITAGLGAGIVSPVPAAIGAVSSVGISQAFKGVQGGGWLTPEEALTEAGTGAVFSVGTGKVLEKFVNPKISEWLTKKAVTKGSFGLKEKVIMKFTGAKPHLARGEVSIPKLDWTAKDVPRTFKPLPESEFYRKFMHISKYTDIGWELTNAPRMGGVMFTKVPSPSISGAIQVPRSILAGLTGKELVGLESIAKESYFEGLRGFERESIAKAKPEEYIPRLGSFSRAKTWAGGWSGELGFWKETKLLPFTTQSQVTRMGIHPYVPKITSGPKKIPTTLLGPLISGLPKIPSFKTKVKKKPKITPTPIPWITSKPRIEPFEKPKRKTKSVPIVVPIPKITPAIIPEQAPKITPGEMSKIAPKITSKTIFRFEPPKISAPSLPKPPPPPPLLRFSERKRKSKRGKLSGLWFTRTHEILTPKQLLGKFQGKTYRKRKRKIKRGRKKRTKRKR